MRKPWGSAAAVAVALLSWRNVRRRSPRQRPRPPGLPATGGHGDFATRFRLSNRSGKACRRAGVPAGRLGGWAGVSVFGDGAIQGCGPDNVTPSCGKPVSTTQPRTLTVTRSTAQPATEVLPAPGGTTGFTPLRTGSRTAGS